MTFDKSRVYTALNAEELEVGSTVILANCLELLQAEVKSNSWPTLVRRLDGVMGTSFTNRFKSSDKIYNLAYVVRTVDEAESEEEEKWIVYLNRRDNNNNYLSACLEEEWESVQKDFHAKTKLFVGSEDEAIKWYKARQKFTETIKGWEDGKTIQVNTFEDKWADCAETPHWLADCEYRTKPDELVWTDLKVGDVLVSDTDGGWQLKKMVVGIHSSPKTQLHICIGDAGWIHDDDLKGWRKEE